MQILLYVILFILTLIMLLDIKIDKNYETRNYILWFDFKCHRKFIILPFKFKIKNEKKD